MTRFTAYEETTSGELGRTLAEGNDLQAIRARFADEYHVIVYERDLDNLDAYGVPEIVASARVCLIEPTDTDLSYFVC